MKASAKCRGTPTSTGRIGGRAGDRAGCASSEKGGSDQDRDEVTKPSPRQAPECDQDLRPGTMLMNPQ
jgi:hypothetical protein